LSQEVSDAVVEVVGLSLLPLGATTVVAIRLATGDGSIDDRLCDAGEDIGRNVPAVLVAGTVGSLTSGGQKACQSVWTRFMQRMGFGNSADSGIRIRPIDPATGA
jgi:hypothetical protein